MGAGRRQRRGRGRGNDGRPRLVVDATALVATIDIDQTGNVIDGRCPGLTPVPEPGRRPPRSERRRNQQQACRARILPV